MALVERISQGLQLPISLIRQLERKASHAYKQYVVPKRTEGYRTIHHPSRELKALQRWLVRNVIERWPVHDAAVAYRRGVSTRENARRHLGGRYLLRLDLRDFFPSITAADIQHFLATKPPGTEEWDQADRNLFVQLVCRGGKLTIGAPTSPGLSNSICFNLDSELAGLSASNDAVYTRYADDLYFSTVHPHVLAKFEGWVEEVLNDLECPAALETNEDKTWHTSKKGRRQVTGLVLSSDGRVCVGRARKRFIRRQLHLLDDLGADDLRSLQGHIAYAVSVEPDFVNSLILKYGKETIDRARGMT